MLNSNPSLMNFIRLYCCCYNIFYEDNFVVKKFIYNL